MPEIVNVNWQRWFAPPPRSLWYIWLEPANGGALQGKVLLKILQNSQENASVRSSFLIKKEKASGLQLY